MNIQITARHERTISEETRKWIEDEIRDLEKFYDKISSAQVVCDKEEHKKGSEDIVKINLNIDGGVVVGTATDENLGKAFDEAKRKLVEQLKKKNELKKNYVGKGLNEMQEATDDEDNI